MNVNIKAPDYTAETVRGVIPVREYDAVIVGSGAAGFGCALSLIYGGYKNIAIVTEGRMMGTSRNTGSDKQTYYRLADGDRAADMAADMTAGGSMHGDLAFVEAVCSPRGFHRLTALGVPFPYNEYGEYTGYRTDHDTAGRATSCGPLTSKFMTEALEREATEKKIPFYDGYRAVEIVTDSGRAAGILTVSNSEVTKENESGYAVFSSPNIVWAVGGPSAIYESTVYPESQTCALGAAFCAGASGINLTESQFGMASVSPRWNVSGSYQQVLPRYVSTDADGGGEREFLSDYIPDPGDLLDAVFKKGYEWPFSASKIYADGHYLSSAVDLAVFSERMRGRRVFLDFTRDPGELCPSGKTDLSLIGSEAREYLYNCGCTGNTPIERLAEMNEPAIELYRSRGVDLYREKLEISVCAQHCNGGIEVDKWYESSVGGLFVVGEAAGIFGVQRPGGSALNSTQVGGIRAAEKIISRKTEFVRICEEHIADSLAVGTGAVMLSYNDILSRRALYAGMMTECCSFLRDVKKIRGMAEFVRDEITGFSRYGADSVRALSELYINRDILITQAAILASSQFYIEHGGLSRGSYLVTDRAAEDVLLSREQLTQDMSRSGYVLTAAVNSVPGDFSCDFEPVRPIPSGQYWFERVYREYRGGEIYEK